MSEANALDNVISFFNPQAGAKRARARLASIRRAAMKARRVADETRTGKPQALRQMRRLAPAWSGYGIDREISPATIHSLRVPSRS